MICLTTYSKYSADQNSQDLGEQLAHVVTVAVKSTCKSVSPLKEELPIKYVCLDCIFNEFTHLKRLS